MKLYICIEKDKYELPLAVADSQRELARMLGVNSRAVSQGIYNSRKGKNSKYKEVMVDDD